MYVSPLKALAVDVERNLRGIETPYYLALGPNYDATISPRFTTTQGPLLRGEFRERFEEGQLTIRGAAIDQLIRSHPWHAEAAMGLG